MAKTEMDRSEPIVQSYQFVRQFHDLAASDLPLVGGKNASLGEMYRELTAEGVKVPDGFATTAAAYR